MAEMQKEKQSVLATVSWLLCLQAEELFNSLKPFPHDIVYSAEQQV